MAAEIENLIKDNTGADPGAEDADIVICKKCRMPMEPKDRCSCRKWLCYRCCLCDLDCDGCNCSHHIGKFKHYL